MKYFLMASIIAPFLMIKTSNVWGLATSGSCFLISGAACRDAMEGEKGNFENWSTLTDQQVTDLKRRVCRSCGCDSNTVKMLPLQDRNSEIIAIYITPNKIVSLDNKVGACVNYVDENRADNLPGYRLDCVHPASKDSCEQLGKDLCGNSLNVVRSSANTFVFEEGKDCGPASNEPETPKDTGPRLNNRGFRPVDIWEGIKRAVIGIF